MTPDEYAQLREVADMRGKAIAILTESWAQRKRWHQARYQALRNTLRKKEEIIRDLELQIELLKDEAQHGPL